MRPSFLNRYTSLPVALDVLYRRRLTLLSPDLWEDRNDAHYLQRYQSARKLTTVLAICFSARREAFHFWKVFSNGPSGVCIEFDRRKLIETFPKWSGFRCNDVTYSLIRDVTDRRPPVKTWPFLKRKAFEDEREFRVIYESDEDHEREKHVDISLTCVHRVTLSPWLPDSVSESVRKIIRRIDGCNELTVNRSSLINNSGWRKAIE